MVVRHPGWVSHPLRVIAVRFHRIADNLAAPADLNARKIADRLSNRYGRQQCVLVTFVQLERHRAAAPEIRTAGCIVRWRGRRDLLALRSKKDQTPALLRNAIMSREEDLRRHMIAMLL